MSLLDVVKRAAIQAVKAENPIIVLFGLVNKVNPLEINVEQRFTLTADFLIVPESMTQFEIDLKHVHSFNTSQTEEALTQKIVIREGLRQGDKVILLRIQGGQQYLVLDKVVA